LRRREIGESVWFIVSFAGTAGLLLVGQYLVFFDELMETVPAQHSAVVVSLALTLQYLSTATAPLLGSFFANQAGLRGGLYVSALIALLGFGLFAIGQEGTHP
jgi:hypothetical protein